MSSMVRVSVLSMLALPVLTASAPVAGQEARQAVPDAHHWDQARASLVATQPGRMAYAVSRWESLSASPNYGFEDYSGFLLSYPGFPEDWKLRNYAEGKLDQQQIEPSRIVAFFDRFPPRTNPGRAHYALALAALQRPEAREAARAAWRGGKMSATAEATLFSLHGRFFTQDDHDARMDALLWDREVDAATRQFAYVSPASRDLFMARLSAVQGSNPVTLGIRVPEYANSDPGYLFNTVRQLRKAGNAPAAISLLANRPRLSRLPHDPERWVEELLVTARMAGAQPAVRIASSIDDAFPPGADISAMSFGLRDDYTSLMWLGGTKALKSLGDARTAAPLFYRYGVAARTPQTRSKGFYWAGVASAQAGDSSEANRYFEMAAAYPAQFYGLLALERLGRPIPNLNAQPVAAPTAAERAAFQAQPLTGAVREVARGTQWRTAIRFFRAIAANSRTEADHVMVAQFAQEIGRRDLAVILGEEAQAQGHRDFYRIAFPTIPTPAGTDWTMVHAITRQESQFAQNAISHAGARGLMQLMPGTAREQAGRLGMAYMQASLMDDASYNIRLGDSYFIRMLNYFGGAYPLAVAAYNAGPGNVNKWLAANGDPRQGSIDWLDWIEQIPITETRYYVQRVLENAAVYEAMHPEKAPYGKPRSISRFIGKRTTG